MEKKNEMDQVEVESLNSPKLNVHGIEEFENRLEMSGWITPNMCNWSWYGDC